MKPGEFSVIELDDSGDARGSSFSIPAELLAGRFPVADAHIAAIEPGAVRGNHYHLERHELLIITFTDRWSLHWDDGADSPVQHRTFGGSGAVVVSMPTGMSHAIRNDGAEPMQLVALTDGPYDPARPDAHPRAVV